MEERVQATSQFGLQKCNKRQKSSTKNEISNLPDDILVSIMSLLPMKDAARCSVLSRRWRYLWTFITGTLEFDCYMEDRSIRELVEAERPRFVDWVNRVLKLHQAPTLDGLKVCFDMDDDKSYECDIDGWIKFAIEKKVKLLELDFTCFCWCFIRGNYALPPQFFCNSQFSSLTSLRLNSVDVSGEALAYFISGCPFLEMLSVTISQSLVDLKISGPSLKLKYLEIIQCFKLKNMEISAINLVSFTYHGPKISMPLKNVPCLREVSFGSYYGSFLVQNFNQLSSCFSQIETLKFNLMIKPFVSFPKFPKLRNLKHLELFINAHWCQSLLPCLSLLKACPSLNRLVLELVNLEVSTQEKVKVRKAKRPHRCLKVVELVGFVGCTVDVELALHLLKNSVSLEMIIIDPRNPFRNKSRSVIREPKKKKLAVDVRAGPIERRLPPGVELVIL